MNMLFTTPMVEHLTLMRAVDHPAMMRLTTLFQQSSDGGEAGAAILVGGFSLVTRLLQLKK